MAGQTDEGHIVQAIEAIIEGLYDLLDMLELPGEQPVVERLRVARREVDAVRVRGEKKPKEEDKEQQRAAGEID